MDIISETSNNNIVFLLDTSFFLDFKKDVISFKLSSQHHFTIQFPFITLYFTKSYMLYRPVGQELVASLAPVYKDMLRS